MRERFNGNIKSLDVSNNSFFSFVINKLWLIERLTGESGDAHEEAGLSMCRLGEQPALVSEHICSFCHLC